MQVSLEELIVGGVSLLEMSCKICQGHARLNWNKRSSCKILQELAERSCKILAIIFQDM